MENDIEDIKKTINTVNINSADALMQNRNIEQLRSLIENTAKTMLYMAEKIGLEKDILFHIVQIIKLIKN